MVNKAAFILVVAVIFSGHWVHAQRGYRLEVLPFPGTEFAETLPHETSFPDSLSRHRALQAYLSGLYERGYLAASFDSLGGDTGRMPAYLDQGSMYTWAHIDAGRVDEGALSATGYRDKLYEGKLFNREQIRQLQESLLVYYENNGYPFAAVRLSAVQIEGDRISAALLVEPHSLITIDSVEVNGKANISAVYLYHYLGIKPGDPYNERLVRAVSSRIRELPFIREVKPVQVRFTGKSTTLVLELESVKAGRFTGLIGFLPESKATGKLLVTGEAQLRLLNSFGRGELIHLNWRSLQPRTQDLNVNFEYPFLLSTPFGAGVTFKLYKRDTLYLDLLSTAALHYTLGRGNALKAYLNNKETRVLSTSGAASGYSNVKSTLYGLGYTLRKLDYSLNPRKGFAFSVEGGVGNKRIGDNPAMDADSIVPKSVEYEGVAGVDGFVPLYGRHVLHLGVAGGYRSSKSMFANELYRIGGLSTLRGFDEESIYASSYSTLLVEYRFLLEQNSFLYAFFNGAYYENEVRRLGRELWVDTPYGYGAGISFETRAGIFSINYALGQQQGNPVDLKAGKVHFGIVSSF